MNSNTARLLPPASVCPICVSVCVCLCDSYHSHNWTEWDMSLKSGGCMCLDNISDEFIGQGHRSKFKVIRLGNVNVLTYSDLSDPKVSWPMVWCHNDMRRHSMTSWHDMTSQCDTTSCCHMPCGKTELNYICTKMPLMLPQSGRLACNI